MSIQQYEGATKTFFDNPEDQRRWEVQCDIRKQVWEEMYDVFGWMYIHDADFQEAITDEVNRRVELHFQREKQILGVIEEEKKAPDVPQDVPDDKDLVHLVEIDVPSPETKQESGSEDIEIGDYRDLLRPPPSAESDKKDGEDIFEEEKRLWQEKLDEDVRRWIQETQNGEYECD